MDEKNEIYFGIDISNRYTVISSYRTGMAEPVTLSTVVGSENYLIPTLLSKKKGIGQWFFGDDAKVRTSMGEAVLVEDIYNLSLANASVMVDGSEYEARELLVLFLKKVIGMAGGAAVLAKLSKLVICVEQVSLEVMELMTFVAAKLDIEPNRLMLLDYKECFYYYALNQSPELFFYKVALFDYSGTNLVSYMLNRSQNTTPQVVTIDVHNLGELSDNRDNSFESAIIETFGSELVSSVYLVGDGFDGDWMKTSLARLCRGRKVFLGKNLYSKGACFGGLIKSGIKDWPFIYIGDNELKLNLSLKILDGNELKFFSLIDAGESWYEAKGECEVILDGSADIEFWLQRPESREAHVEILELTDIPNRENRTTRLRITALPVSDKEIAIKIYDLGFGEIAPSSGKTWEHTLSIT